MRGVIIVVTVIIAGGRDKKHPGVIRGFDGVVHPLAVTSPAPAIAGQIGTIINSELQALDGVGGTSAAGAIKKLQPHNLYFPIHADYTYSVVAYRADRPRTVGTVVIIVHRVAAVVEGVVTVGAVLGVDPDIGLEVIVVVINPGVDHPDDDLA